LAGSAKNKKPNNNTQTLQQNHQIHHKHTRAIVWRARTRHGLWVWVSPRSARDRASTTTRRLQQNTRKPKKGAKKNRREAQRTRRRHFFNSGFEMREFGAGPLHQIRGFFAGARGFERTEAVFARKTKVAVKRAGKWVRLRRNRNGNLRGKKVTQQHALRGRIWAGKQGDAPARHAPIVAVAPREEIG